jgi:hypothetical protein
VDYVYKRLLKKESVRNFQKVNKEEKYASKPRVCFATRNFNVFKSAYDIHGMWIYYEVTNKPLMNIDSFIKWNNIWLNKKNCFFGNSFACVWVILSSRIATRNKFKVMTFYGSHVIVKINIFVSLKVIWLLPPRMYSFHVKFIWVEWRDKMRVCKGESVKHAIKRRDELVT